MDELNALSKLKRAGKLHYWRGTVEIDEYELHAICDEIQEEHDKVRDRIAELESLVSDLRDNMHGCEYYHDCGFCEFEECVFEKRMAALGLLKGDARCR